jgi:hypothetical protein
VPPAGVAVVSLVSMQDVARGRPSEKLHPRRAIGDVPAGKHEGDWPALGVCQRMDFGRAPAARAADGLIFLPPFPPEAERCAFTAELSMRSCAGGPPACASAWNKSTQTPLAAQRT